MKKIDLNEFINYLLDQLGQPYVWGGQHLKLTPDNYVTAITRREKDEANRAASIAYCKARFDAGATILYGYDCSGLGMYWLQNVKNVFNHDMTANGMMSTCEIVDAPKRGYWVFRVDADGKATHIGYMVTDTEVVHAKGRAFGVVKERHKSSYWYRTGKPPMFVFDIPVQTRDYVEVKGGSVYVRDGNGVYKDKERKEKNKVIGTAHRGDLLPCYGQDDRDPYWYIVDYKGQRGYISCNERYTRLIQK